MPTNRFISQIIKPLSQEIKELSADPYDDELMEALKMPREYYPRSFPKVDNKPQPGHHPHVASFTHETRDKMERNSFINCVTNLKI